MGTLVGAFLIGSAFLVSLVVSVFGGHPTPLTSDDWRVLGFYVGGFALAGGSLAAFRIHQRKRGIIYLGYMAAGTIVMFAIAFGDQAGKGLGPFEWGLCLALGVLFGAAAAYGHLHYDS